MKKFCHTCRWSDSDSVPGTLKCTNEEVRGTYSYTLGAPEHRSVAICWIERSKIFFAPCGKRGKLWKPKV